MALGKWCRRESLCFCCAVHTHSCDECFSLPFKGQSSLRMAMIIVTPSRQNNCWAIAMPWFENGQCYNEIGDLKINIVKIAIMRLRFVIGQLGCSNNPLCMILGKWGVLKRDRWFHCWQKFQVEIAWTYHTENASFCWTLEAWAQ